MIVRKRKGESVNVFYEKSVKHNASCPGSIMLVFPQHYTYTSYVPNRSEPCHHHHFIMINVIMNAITFLT